MAIERKVLIESVTVYGDGTVSLLLNKAIVEDGDKVAERLHRVTLPADMKPGDIEKYLETVDGAVQREKFPSMPAAIRPLINAARKLVLK